MRLSQDTSPATLSEDTSSSVLEQARVMVEEFLERSMVPDPDGAAQFLAPGRHDPFHGCNEDAAPA
jgi:hypothetical protein